MLCLAISHDGTVAVSGHFDRALRIWDTRSGKIIHTLSGHERSIESTDLTANGALAISGSADGGIRTWDVRAGQCKTVFQTKSNCKIDSVSFSADARFALSNRDANDPLGEKPLLLWDVPTGKLIREFSSEILGMVGSTRISPNGALAACDGQDGFARFFDTKSGKVVSTLQAVGENEAVCSMQFSSDSSRLFTGSGEGVGGVWELASKRNLATLTGHAKSIRCFSVSADTTIGATAGGDGDVRIWDLQSGACLKVLPHSETQTRVAMSADARTVISGAWDNTVQIWSLEWSA